MMTINYISSTCFKRILTVGLTAILMLPSVYAANETWVGLGGGNNWRINENWADGSFPVDGADLVFSGTTRLSPNNNNAAGIGFPTITFDSTAGAFTITGSSILLNGGITNNSGNLQKINIGLALSADCEANTAAGSIEIGGVISGNGGLTKRGNYTLTLSGANAYIGDTIVQAGTLRVDSAFLNDTAAVRITSGAILELDFNGTDSIGGLYFDGVLQASGTWGAPGSGADHETQRISGSGMLKATAGRRLSLGIISG